MNTRMLRMILLLVPTALGIAIASCSSATPDPGNQGTSQVTEALTGGCANGHTATSFGVGMVGCAGSVTWNNRATLCGAGFHPASAWDWYILSISGSPVPAHNYWVNDVLGWAGSNGNCMATHAALTGGNSCGANQPMRLCTPSGSDPEGNSCNWTHCGLDSTVNLYFGGCVGNSTAGTLCVANGCANGVVTQQFDRMVGCAGNTSWGNASGLCAMGWRLATAYEWIGHSGGATPTHDYWTSDLLPYNGSGPNNCAADYNGTLSGCESSPMRVCTSNGNDPEGNHCNWYNCGIGANTPNQHFGGCAGNTTAGALCVPNQGCANDLQDDVFTNGIVGCAGTVGFSSKNNLCAPGFAAARPMEWTASHGAATPTYSYWTADPLNFSGSGPGACAANETTGSNCGSTTPMRVCPSTSPDPKGNVCNWTNCGLETNSPNQFFGGCAGNNTAGTLCGKTDLVMITDGFQNITSQDFETNDLATQGDIFDGCITAGVHRVMRFTTRSRNIGTADAVLGSPPANTNTFSPVFIWSQAHNHWHVRHFNTYSMVNNATQARASGFKQSFCLEDVGGPVDPNGGPRSGFTCNNMGVTAGFEDVYSAGLACQYIVMDGVGDGTYTFTAETNVSRVIPEADYANNITYHTLQVSGNTVTGLN